VYREKEYRFTITGDQIKLLCDAKSSDHTFIKHQRGSYIVYYKLVNKEDLTELYEINSYAIYEGDIFQVTAFNGGYEITTSDQELAYNHDMKRSDKYAYTLFVTEGDIEIYEEKIPITG